MNRKRVVLYTRNLNEPDNLRQAIGTLQQIPGVCDVREDDLKVTTGSRPLATRLMVEYDTNDTAPNALASELGNLGFPVVMQEEPGEEFMHTHMTTGLKDDRSFTPPPAFDHDGDYRTIY